MFTDKKADQRISLRFPISNVMNRSQFISARADPRTRADKWQSFNQNVRNQTNEIKKKGNNKCTKANKGQTNKNNKKFLVITRNFLVITRNFLVNTCIRNFLVITRNFLVITKSNKQKTGVIRILATQKFDSTPLQYCTP